VKSSFCVKVRALSLVVIGLLGTALSQGQQKCVSLGYGVVTDDGYSEFVFAAAPQDGATRSISYAYQKYASGWKSCATIPCAPYQHHAYTFGPVQILENSPDPGRSSAPWKEPTVAIAVVAGSGAQYQFGEGERIEVDYTWNHSYCQSLAWFRMEHNQTRTLSVMVPKDATILERGVKVRDGNDGSSWHTCDLKKNSSCEGMGEIDYLPITNVADNMLTSLGGTRTAMGYQVTIKNGSSCCVRNVEFYVNYKLP